MPVLQCPRPRRRARSIAAVALAVLVPGAPAPCVAATYYVRQTAGDDTNDGLTPATAWQHAGKLSAAMQAGDTAFVGPGISLEHVTGAVLRGNRLVGKMPSRSCR